MIDLTEKDTYVYTVGINRCLKESQTLSLIIGQNVKHSVVKRVTCIGMFDLRGIRGVGFGCPFRQQY